MIKSQRKFENGDDVRIRMVSGESISLSGQEILEASFSFPSDLFRLDVILIDDYVINTKYIESIKIRKDH